MVNAMSVCVNPLSVCGQALTILTQRISRIFCYFIDDSSPRQASYCAPRSGIFIFAFHYSDLFYTVAYQWCK